jgi:predicted transcriptional regulator
VSGAEREHNRSMATSEKPMPSIPSSLLAEMERLARAQARTVGEVLTEAVDRYVKDQQWQSLKAYGRERALARGLTEADVPRLIEESRMESQTASRLES